MRPTATSPSTCRTIESDKNMKYTKLQLIYIRLTTRCPLCNKRLLFKPIRENMWARKWAEDDPPLTHVECQPMNAFSGRMESIPTPDIDEFDKNDPILWTMEDEHGWGCVYQAKYITDKRLKEYKSKRAWSSCPGASIVGRASVDESGAVQAELFDVQTGISIPFGEANTLAEMIHVLQAELLRRGVGVWQP